ncbi:MAG: ABC transporter ATP-binding protein [Eubacterium sp.]|nr:ABC transporter ATP-binding protein [Eubacterium sp.]
MAVIDCNHVSIRYITGDFKSIGLKEYVMRKLTRNFKVKEFWADRDITFQLEKGDMLGIIGSNGAGKSTLLKAVTGIMLPAEGSVRTKGSIAALLELSSGFDDQMTVQENAYLRGAMLGYTREFMDQMYPEIIKFAELEDFQDYTFKQLSSGMKSRLAFSIACLVEPDILILDEVLSVGDGAFRRKSGDKMREILDSGITGILVSHIVGQVRELCNKILWLDHGKQIAFTDETDLYLDAYEEFLHTKKLPKNREDVLLLADAFHVRTAKERQEKEKKEMERLEQILEEGKKETAMDAAISIIRKNNPDLLDEDKVNEYLRGDSK